jgi:hypothetical protein
MRKENKTLRKKWKWTRKKTLTENNKKEGTEDQGSGTWIATFHSLLSNTNSLVMYQSFKSLFTDSYHIKFGRHLPFFSLPNRLITLLWTDASIGLRWICPNHLKQYCTSFSSIDVTPSLSRMSAFQTRSLLVLPQIHCSMCISAMLSCWTCRLLVGQHSAPYNMVGRIVIL